MKKHPLNLLVLILAICFFVLPIWVLTVQSLIPPFDAMLVSMYAEPLRLFTAMPVLEQFDLLLSRHGSFPGVIVRDLLSGFLSALIQTLISVVSGYLLAHYRNHFNRQVVMLFTLTLVLPMQMYLVSVYRITEWSGLAGHPIIMYLIAAFSPLGAVFMRQVFLGMSGEYVEAFRMEETRMSRLLAYIVFPFGFPAACVLFLFSFAETWSMVEQPLFLLTNKNLYPISMLLYEIRSGEPDIVYAASFSALLPAWITAIILAGGWYVIKKRNVNM